jgi:hypothetical protein
MCPIASAAQSATAGKNKCTVTAVAPTLSSKNLFGQATVLCTLATSVSVEIGVVELDGTVEDTLVPIAVRTVTVAVSANKAATIATATATCLNTETGNEEYATKAQVNISGTVSAWDRTLPKTDQYAC